MKRSSILKGVMCLSLCLVPVFATAENWVRFEGKGPAGAKLQLTGILTKPEGDGPFPAVVLLCGCGGLKSEADAKLMNTWAQRLMSWGYVSLQLDSFGPRKYDSICDDTNSVSSSMRSNDAYSAKSYLSKLAFVDPEKMAAMGWSHGGWAIMRIVDGVSRNQDSKPFQAAIAYYPYCERVSRFDTPLLVLSGRKDDWCPASLCEYLEKSGSVKDSKQEFKLLVYPNAYHAFDLEGLNADFYGHHIEYDPKATADSIIQARDFLAKYLGKE